MTDLSHLHTNKLNIYFTCKNNPKHFYSLREIKKKLITFYPKIKQVTDFLTERKKITGL